jgi:Holliday junction resolvasome RuvABC ATP-dependent DNA helicase subunit
MKFTALSPVVEEYLYSAMEDYRIDIMIDKGSFGAFHSD